jgi:serine/threonine protein kinase
MNTTFKLIYIYIYILYIQDYEVAKLTDFGLARILPAYAGDREDVNPKTTPKIGPPKYRAPEVEKHDSELDPTYAFSSDVYGYGVMCYQLIDQVKKRRKKSHPHEVDFVTGLGNACCEEDPRARPTAAMCLAKCREFLGETWTANDRMWGNPNPSERCAYWTTDMMDVGTFKKVRAVMEEEQSKERSSSGLEQGVTPTTAPARGNGDGNGDGGNRKIVHNTVGGIDDRNNDSDDNDDFDDDGEDDDIQKRHENEQKLLKMFEDERRFQAKNASGAAAMRTTTVRNDGDYNNNYNDKNNNNIGTGTTTPTTTTTTSLRRRVIEQGGKEGKGLNRKRSKQLMVGEPNNNDEQNHMDIGGNNNTRNNIHNNNNNAAGGGGSIQNTQVAMVRSADGRITKTSSLGEDSDSQTPVSKYSRGENIQNETGPSAVRRLNSLSTLGMGDLKVEETRI